MKATLDLREAKAANKTPEYSKVHTKTS